MARKKNPAAVALGRLGGLKAAGKGARVRAANMPAEERSAQASHAAKARMEKLTSTQRKAIAKKAAAARWNKKD